MASQYEKMKNNYDKYVSQPFIDPEIVREMKNQLDYANTVDFDKVKRARDILEQK